MGKISAFLGFFLAAMGVQAQAEIKVIDARGTVEMTADGQATIKDLVLVLRITAGSGSSTGQGIAIRPTDPNELSRLAVPPLPSPGPPDPGHLGLVSYTQAAKSRVSDPVREETALRVRAVYRFLERQMVARKVQSFEHLARETRELRRFISNGAGPAWDQWERELGNRITELRQTSQIVTIQDMIPVHRAIADGLAPVEREAEKVWPLLMEVLAVEFQR